MRIYFAFDAQPVQLKLVNWILGRKDIDRTVLMDEMKKEMDAKRADSTAKTPIVDANKVFVGFQDEVKKWALKLGNMGNQFQDCIYQRCGKEDGDFKYIFGESNNPDDITSSYQHKVNDVYDTMKNAILFKEGSFQERAEKILEGFKRKNEKLEKLVADANQILVENNKNSEEDGNMSFDEQEEKSWNHLERDCQELVRDGWHVYKVEKYEDLRNVAADCTEWCVARRDSGRDYFYKTYGPPYYLFCKGRRRPTILMHIKSQQFKGVDDSKYKPDRPTSMDAIEMGRELLRKLGKLERFDSREDFSIFNDGVELEKPKFHDSDVIEYSTDEELSGILARTDSIDEASKIAKMATNYEVMSGAYEKVRSGGEQPLVYTTAMSIAEKKGLPSKIGSENAKRLYFRILDDQEGIERKRLIKAILYNVDDPIVGDILERYDDRSAVSEYILMNKEPSDSFVEYVIRNGKRDLAMKIIDNIEGNISQYRKFVEAYHDDEEIMSCLLNDSRNYAEAFPLIAKTTGSKAVIEKLVNLVCHGYFYEDSICGEIEKALWRKVQDRGMLQMLYNGKGHFKDEEVSEIMWDNAETVSQKCIALEKRDASEDEVDAYFDEVIDGLDCTSEKNAVEYFTWHVSSDRRMRLCEKAGYDFDLFSDNLKALPIEAKVAIAERMDKISINDAYYFLSSVYDADNGYAIDGTDGNDRLLLEIVRKCDDRNTLYKIIHSSSSERVLKYIVENKDIDLKTAFEIMQKNNGVATPEIMEKYAGIAVEKGDSATCIGLAGIRGCPNSLLKTMMERFIHVPTVISSLIAIGLEKGVVQVDGKAIEKYFQNAFHGDTHDNVERIFEILKNDSGRIRRMVEFLFESSELSDRDKGFLSFYIVIVERELSLPAGAISPCIEWCSRSDKDKNYEHVLHSPSANEEQIRRALDNMRYGFMLYHEMHRLTPLAREIAREYESEGRLNELDWGDVAYSDDATAEELAEALNHIDENTPPRFYQKLLGNPNCTREIAEKALQSIDIGKYMEDNCRMRAVTRWTGSGILHLKDADGNDRYDFNRWKDLISVLHSLDSLDEIRKVVEYKPKGRRRGRASDYEDSKYWFFHEVASNPNCTLDYIRELSKKEKDMDSRLLDCYIESHRSMPTSEIRTIIEENEESLKRNPQFLSPIFSCDNITEEIAVDFIRKYDYVNAGRLLANPSLTEGMLLEMVDATLDDSMLEKIADSPKATEKVCEKVLEMFIGYKSISAALKKVKDKEIKRKYSERFENEVRIHSNKSWTNSHAIADEINGETDDARLNELIGRLYRRIEICSDGRGSYYEPLEEVKAITNPRALSILSKSRNREVVKCVLRNKHIDPKTTLSILKRNMSADTLRIASDSDDKDVLMLVCCRTDSQDDINKIMRFSHKLRYFTSDDIMKMIIMNKSLKFEILRCAYFKLSDDQLRYLSERLRDRDIEWLVDKVMQHRHPDGMEAKADRIVRRMLKASIIVDRIVSDYKE